MRVGGGPLCPVGRDERLRERLGGLCTGAPLDRAQHEVRGEVADVDLPVALADGVEIEQADAGGAHQHLLVVEVAMHERGSRRPVRRDVPLEGREGRFEGGGEPREERGDEPDPGSDDGEVVSRPEAPLDGVRGESVKGGERGRDACHEFPGRGGAQQEVQLGEVGADARHREGRLRGVSRDGLLGEGDRSAGAVGKHLAVDGTRRIPLFVAQLAAHPRPVPGDRAAPEPHRPQRRFDPCGIQRER